VAISEHVLFKSDKGTVFFRETVKRGLQANQAIENAMAMSFPVIAINARSLVFITTPLLFNGSGFASANYWSSSENNTNNAWNQNFNSGNQNNNNKNNTNYVRAVRDFKQNNQRLSK
jgi:hypothetical protein